jgi:hypothetical protein
VRLLSVRRLIRVPRALPGAQVGSAWNPILLAPLFQLFFTVLNYVWTFQLLSNLRARRGTMQQLQRAAAPASQQQQGGPRREKCL